LMNMSSGDNPFTGSITIAPNTRVTLSGEDAFINASSFTNNGVLALAADQTLNNLSGSGTIDVGEHTLTMNNDRLCQITGAIGGEHSLLIKTGDGTLQIVNQAKGAVRAESFVISSGSLDMEGYFTGTLKVVNDTIEIEEATTFSPGVSLGAIDIDGDFILADGAVLLMEIGGKTFDLNDQLILNGQVTFEEGAIVQFALSDDSTYAPVVGDMIAVNMPKVNWTAVTFSSSDFSLSYYDDKEGLQYIKAEANNPTKRIPTKGVAAVPEPSTWALMALGVVVLFLRKRVRNLK
ncbi:MAG: PEP-CTERM sorting domain-containing protein, partial [Thermoguttaceae bacterium]|nr:PEP-CTERM sorting domain-containing protein [Thermoguttaceae bacterium]